MSGDLPAAYSSASTSRNRREDEEDGRSSSDSLRAMNAQMKQEGHRAQSFLEKKWAKMQKKLKKSDRSRSPSSRRSRHRDDDRRSHRDRSPRSSERHGHHMEKSDSRRDSGRPSRDGHRSSHRRSHRDAFGEHDDRTAESPPRRRHHRDREDGDRYHRDDERSQRRRHVPCLLANAPATKDGRIDDEHRPAYLTDEVIRHAEEIQRRRRVWQRGREREERHKAAEEKDILAKHRDGEDLPTRTGGSLVDSYTTGEATCNPAATSFVPSTSNPEPPADTAALKWTAMSTSVSGGASQQDKFRKLMGIKTAIGPPTDPAKSVDIDATVEANKANYVLSSLEQQFATGRRTQLSRGMGLGFGSASSWNK